MKAHPPFLLVPIVALSALLAVLDRGESAVLLNYNFDGGSLAPTSTDANVTAGSITATGFGTEVTDWGGSASGNNLFVRANATNSSLNVSSDYFEFTFSPAAGFELDLTSFTLNTLVSVAAGAAAPYTANYAIRTSVDSFAANLPTVPSPLLLTRSAEGGSASGSGTVDLSGSSLQDLTSPVTFRIYIFDNQNHANDIARVDTLVINGSITAVPEPSALFILGLAALVFPCFRRSRSGAKAV